VLNTAQFVSSTLNNNEVIQAVDSFMEQSAQEFATDAPITDADESARSLCAETSS
jgi:hypothetical protein